MLSQPPMQLMHRRPNVGIEVDREDDLNLFRVAPGQLAHCSADLPQWLAETFPAVGGDQHEPAGIER